MIEICCKVIGEQKILRGIFIMKKMLVIPAVTLALAGIGASTSVAAEVDFIKSDTLAKADSMKPASSTLVKSKKGYIFPLDEKKVTGTSSYNEIRIENKKKKTHKGIDFAAPEGTIIMAAKDGEVVFAEFGEKGSGFGGYGNVVVIKHPVYDKKGKETKDTRYTLYAHMNKIEVKKGQKITVGSKIGEVGNTGASSGNHLHFEVKTTFKFGQVNPNDYLPKYKKK
ncbi:peptidase M23 [Bacillus cereus]|nr:peptidase M23 [Bacillus cereus]PGU65998.1 peptidase M23 [Bacillus cereus]